MLRKTNQNRVDWGMFPEIRFTEATRKDPGLDFGENGHTISSRDAAPSSELQTVPLLLS